LGPKGFEGCSVPTLALLTACREVGVFYKRWVVKSSETTMQETPTASAESAFSANCRSPEIDLARRASTAGNTAILAYFTRVNTFRNMIPAVPIQSRPPG
jgi:hypothetical protein